MNKQTIYCGPWSDKNMRYEYDTICYRKVLGNPMIIVNHCKIKFECDIYFGNSKYNWYVAGFGAKEYDTLKECKEDVDYLLNNPQQLWGNEISIKFIDRETFDKLSLLI